MKLVKRTEIEKPNEVFNLHVAEDHNYVVNGAVVSNCHMAKAEVIKTLLTSVMAGVPIRWGLTGTVPKEMFESQALLVSLGPVINKLAASDLQDLGVLAQCHVNIVQLMDAVDFRDYQSELKYLTTTEKRIEFIAKLINKVKDGGNTLILVDRIECGQLLQKYLSSLFSELEDKPDVVFVSGSTKSTARKEEYKEVATVNNKIIIATYGIAAVGINIPRIFNLVLFEAGKSFVRVIQSIGRGIRKAEDKTHVEIWDITSTCKFSKRHLTKRKQYYRDAKYEFTQENVDWMNAV
jgi:superfamily II DNA or RNA helicase